MAQNEIIKINPDILLIVITINPIDLTVQSHILSNGWNEIPKIPLQRKVKSKKKIWKYILSQYPLI